jgi:hypothetical protein
MLIISVSLYGFMVLGHGECYFLNSLWIPVMHTVDADVYIYVKGAIEQEPLGTGP